MKSFSRSASHVVCSVILTLTVVGHIFAQNPVPTITNPVQPQAVAPGSAAFTLTVRGANFVPGAVVGWNGSPRTTTFVSRDELQAKILASDVSAPTAGFISVTNPGGPSSSASYGTVEVNWPHTVSVGAGLKLLYRYEENVWTTQLADVNHDGMLDLIQVGGLGHVVTWLGNGNGTFSPGCINKTDWAAGLAYGDFDGDGNIDLATAYSGIRVFLGKGDGKFVKLGRFGDWYQEFPLQMAVADFNHDGALDIAVADQGAGLQILLGNGDGTFGRQTTYASGFQIDLRTADFNGDGNLDLLTHGYDSLGSVQVYFWQGHADGSFQDPAIVTGTGTFASHFSPSVFLDDFNHDGAFDAFVGVQGGFDTLMGNGDGTFTAPAFYPSGYATDSELGYGFGDFNTDGNSDVLISNANTFRFGMLAGNSDGTFDSITPITLHGQYSGDLGINAGDFNSDGKLDFVVSGIEIFTQQ